MPYQHLSRLFDIRGLLPFKDLPQSAAKLHYFEIDRHPKAVALLNGSHKWLSRQSAPRRYLCQLKVHCVINYFKLIGFIKAIKIS
jgi:hypothetical protein